MTRTYRVLVTVQIEGDRETLPTLEEVTSEVLLAVHQESIRCSARPIDYDDLTPDNLPFPIHQ